MLSLAWKSALLKLRICTAPPPSSVILLPPSMTVFLLVGRLSVAVTWMVTGALPQLKVMMPPVVTAVCSGLKVQLAAVPVPTTVVGCEVSAGCPAAGTPAVHEPLGLPASPVVPPSEAPPDELPLLEPELEPLPELDPLPELEPLLESSAGAPAATAVAPVGSVAAGAAPAAGQSATRREHHAERGPKQRLEHVHSPRRITIAPSRAAEKPDAPRPAHASDAQGPTALAIVSRSVSRSYGLPSVPSQPSPARLWA